MITETGSSFSRRNFLAAAGCSFVGTSALTRALAENNACIENGSHGISIGHRDTDNLIRGNDILRSGKTGVLFRPERGKAFAPHRNVVENNRIIDSGGDDGIGVDVQGEVESITLQKNEIKETRNPAHRTGVRVGSETKDVRLIDNEIVGFSTDIVEPGN